MRRFRLRTLMFVVVAIGSALAAAREGHGLWGISHAHQQKAAGYGQDEARYRRLAARSRKRATRERADAEAYRRGSLPEDADEATRLLFEACSKRGSPMSAETCCRLYMETSEATARYADDRAAEHDKVAEYYAALKRKYGSAARYPWLPVAPDPPGPR